MKLYFYILPLFFLSWSCSENNTTNNDAAISTSISDLKNYLNLEKYAPIAVQWEYSKIGSDNNSRLSDLGPNDYLLEALLTFDTQTINQIKKDYSLLSVALKKLNKNAFTFNWLTDSTILQVNNCKSQYDIQLFKHAVNGGFIILDDQTIVLYYTTQ